MKVSDLYQKLSYGELSNLSIGNDGFGDIADSKKSRIIHYANRALLRLYTRYLIKESNVLISQIEGRTLYRLSSRYAVSNPEPVPGDPVYIQDTPENPFLNDVVKITAVFGHDGCELPLNDAEHPKSVFTPQTNVLQITRPVAGKLLGISYQAKHIPLSTTSPSQIIDLPDVLEESFTTLIAHYVFSDMNGAENLAKSQEYLAKYERLYSEIEGLDLVNNSQSTTNIRFQRNGWV